MPVSEVTSRQQLRSASRHQLLLIPRYRLRTFGRRAFAVAGPTFWNSLADEPRTYSSDRFKLALKTFLFALLTSVFSALEVLALYKLVIDIDSDIDCAGDQVLEWDGSSLQDATFEEARDIMSRSGDTVQVVLMHCRYHTPVQVHLYDVHARP